MIREAGTGGRPVAVAVLVLALVVLSGCSGLPVGTDPGSPTVTGEREPTRWPGASDGSGPDEVEGTIEVHFINVGQGDATLVVGPTGETMLVDSGDWEDGGDHVLSYLQRQGIDRIDYLVTTHAHADHIGGHAAVIEYYETEADGVGAVYDPGIAAASRTYERYLDAVERHDVDLFVTRAGDRVPLEGVAVDVLGPPDGFLAGGERNENSVVLRIGFGAAAFLLTGDAEDDGERYLLERYGDGLDATVLKAGHHGARSSTSGPLLDGATPRVVVVSSAADSTYDHPHREVLQRLADRSVPTYWTAVHGHVLLRSDGRDVTVHTQRAATTDPLALREVPSIDPGDPATLQVRTTIAAGESNGASTTEEGANGDPEAVPDREGELAVVTIHADAAGDDRDNLEDEYVVFENVGDGSLDISGWTVTDESGRTYTFPDGVVLEPGDRLALHTGSGTDTPRRRYWEASRPVWNNDGDTVTVWDAQGTVVLREAYP